MRDRGGGSRALLLKGLLRDESFLNAVEQKRVLATLAHFHHHVVEVGQRAIVVASLPEEFEVALEQRAVALLLQRHEFALDEGLDARRQLVFDVLLESPQQVRRQNFVQRLHLTSLLDRAELGFEIFLIGEATSVHEVQEGPELGRVVLQRCARKQHDAPGEIQRVQVAHCASSAVFQAVRLIDHKAAPRHFGERRAVRLDHLVGRQHHVRFVHRVAVALGPVFVHQLVLADDGSGGGVPDIRHHVRAGSPSRGFAFPVHESG